MAMEAGACGVYGILMRDAAEKEIVEVYEEFLEKATDVNGPDSFNDITVQGWYSELYTRLVTAFSRSGVAIPEGACLMYTGVEDDRPGRCDTPAREWVLGFGLFTKPDEYPEMHQTFKKIANWHTWVVLV